MNYFQLQINKTKNGYFYVDTYPIETYVTMTIIDDISGSILVDLILLSISKDLHAETLISLLDGIPPSDIGKHIKLEKLTEELFLKAMGA